MKLALQKKTKIICTIGPASDTYEKLVQLVDAGMNVMRLNFSHGGGEEQQHKIDLARRLEKEKGVYIPVMLDTKGPEIRVGKIENDAVRVNKDDIMRITMNPIIGNNNRFSVSFSGLYDDLLIGDVLQIDDGNLSLKVIEKDGNNRELIVKAVNSHTLKSKKGVNVPSQRLSLPFISEQDERDLIYGAEHGIDFIAASFVREADNILQIKKILASHGGEKIPVIAKIENSFALKNLDEIIQVSDGIMVARGDLGVEIPVEEVPIYQKKIIRKCLHYGKPVITATQMLDSMQSLPRPTRAEVSDVAHAIEQGTDAVMLSAESASGLYPVEATLMQSKIALVMEKQLDYVQFAREAYETSSKMTSDAIANSVATTSRLIEADLIFVFTESGDSARRIARNRPYCPIIAVSDRRKTVLELALVWGVHATYVPKIPQFLEDLEVLALLKSRQFGIGDNNLIIMAGGFPSGVGKTNYMKIIKLNPFKDVIL